MLRKQLILLENPGTALIYVLPFAKFMVFEQRLKALQVLELLPATSPKIWKIGVSG